MTGRIHWEAAPVLARVESGVASLDRGDVGASVFELQRLLRAAGEVLAVDGYFGNETLAKLQHFRATHALGSGTTATASTFAALRAPTRPAPTPMSAPTPSGGSGATTSGGSGATTSGGSGATTSGGSGATTSGGSGATTSGGSGATTSGGSSATTSGAGRFASPFGATTDTRVAQARQILQANGQWPPSDGQVFVVQVDQDLPPVPSDRAGTDAVTRYLSSYTGQTSVFRARADARGGISLLELNAAPFASSAHPGQRTTRGFTDFDGNGTCDIATLRSGVYRYRARASEHRFNPIDNRAMRVMRDLNQDGAVSGRENVRTANATATGMQWHAGHESGPRSVGCQNIRASEFPAFERTLRHCGAAEFTYVLVRRPNDTASGGLIV